MSIEEKELEYEKQKLKDTIDWINKELISISENDNKLKERIADLRKQSKGRYNEELETKEKLYEIVNKNLEKYNEAKEQPYFARIDFREIKRTKESFYIGKFGLGDITTGDEVVIDWRAPIADLYYSGVQGRASYEAPMGWIDGELSLKRKFIVKNGEIKNAFDEGINEIILKSETGVAEGTELADEFLKINLEESVSSKLKDIVATIQNEQNQIIRASKNGAIIIQGSAGSGKTTVALHRLAYLLYKYKKNITGSDVLVVAPNKIFLDYISDVLPNLGVDMVKQKTYEELCLEILNLKGKIINKDKKLALIIENSGNEIEKQITSSCNIKGSLFYKSILDRYVRYIEKKDMLYIEDIKIFEYTLFTQSEIKRLYLKDMINLPLDKRKDEIKRYFNLKLKEKISEVSSKIDFYYDYLISKIKKTMEDGVERRNKLIELYDERDNKKKQVRLDSPKIMEEYFNTWKHENIKKLYMELYNNEEIIDEIAENKFPKGIRNYIKSILNENFENNIIDAEDLTSMLYLKFKIEGVPSKYKFKHIVIDEAQDYSLFQFVALKEMSIYESFTIVGDIGQGIYYFKGIEDWSNLIESVFKDNSSYKTLTQSYRSTVEIIELANIVLEKQKNTLEPAVPVIRHGRKPEIIKIDNNKEFALRLDDVVKEMVNIGKKNIAVVGKNEEECKEIKNILNKNSEFKWEVVKDTDKSFKLDKIIIPAYMTKGLEFDCTVVYNCNEEVYKDNELDKKLLYVVLTRALHFEYIFYQGNISELIVCK